MADVIQMSLSQLSLSQLQQRLRKRQEQRDEFSLTSEKNEHSRRSLLIAEQDIEDIIAEWKRRSAANKVRMKLVLRVVPNPEP
jgi:hypothetical protein